MSPRGIFAAVLSVAAAVLVTPAAAAPVPYTVYEVYRTGKAGPSEFSLHVKVRGAAKPEVLAFAHLKPSGRGYATQQVSLGMFGLGDTRWRTYGWQAPVAAPACPAAALCGSAPSPATIDVVYSFHEGPGHRYLVGGPTGRTSVTPLSKGWKVRKTTVGMRIRTATESDATGIVTGQGTVEHFRGSSLPGGAYGSEVFAEVPCDAGQWTLAAGTDEVDGSTCLPDDLAFTFASAQARTTWGLKGESYGRTDMPIRMVVVDYPKR